MTRIKQELIGGIHTRLKNDLLENQPWWPLTLKRGGSSSYLTIDPVLYRSAMHTSPEASSASGQERMHESDTPGIRLEYLRTNGSKSKAIETNGACSITISNSGTWDAKADITWPDGSITTIPFTSEGLAGKFVPAERYQPLESMVDATKTNGPAPVPLTLQELADILDTFTGRTGSWAAETPSGRSWNPHPNNHIYLYDAGAIIDTPVDYTLIAVLSNFLGASPEANAQMAATIYMPMCANVNQYSRNMVALCGTTYHASEALPSGIGWASPPTITQAIPYTNSHGMTRFLPDPEGVDAANIKYSWANQSGDHRFGHRRFGSLDAKTLQHENTADTGLSPNPKWRSRMCLAMFLKDGTYNLGSGGALIPYIYDPTREIGGEHWKRTQGQHAAKGVYLGGDGLYGTWLPSSRSTEVLPGGRHANASFSPGVDFVQGPFSMAAHGWNYEADMMVHGVNGNLWLPTGSRNLGGNTRTVFENQHAINTGKATLYRAGLSGTTLSIWIDSDEHPSSGYITAGESIYITEMSGSLGWNSTTRDCNGWWLVDTVTVVAEANAPSGNALRLDITCGYTTGDVSEYSADGYVQIGRPKPLDNATYNDPAYAVDPRQWGAGADTPGHRSYTQSLFGTVDDLRPGISTNGLDKAGGNGYNSAENRDALYRRQVQLTGTTDYNYETIDNKAPNPTLTGNVGLRIPPQLGDMGKTTSRFPAVNSGYGNLRSTQWFVKGILLSFWSCIDQETGRHAWDYIKPEDSTGANQWPAGRNRAWPGKRRVDTNYASAPPMLNQFSNTYTESYIDIHIDSDPNYGVASDKYGLSEWGSSGVYADIEVRAYIPAQKDRLTKIWFESGSISPILHGKRSFARCPPSANSWTGWLNENIAKGWGHLPVKSGNEVDVTVDGERWIVTENDFTFADCWWWAWGGSRIFDDQDIINAIIADGAEIPWQGSRTGWGNAGNHLGTGGSSTKFDEGIHNLRFIFNENEMIHHQDGTSKGNDASSKGPVHGFTFEHGALHGNNPDDTHNVWQSIINVTGKDPIIDTISVREIPTEASMPFKAETITYDIDEVAVYRTLTLTGENMTDSQYVRVSICSPGHTNAEWDEFGQAPGTPYENFADLDLAWSGGYGAISLLDLPQSALTDGFTIRFEFTIPDSNTSTEYEWEGMPRILTWDIDYDLTPTTTLSVTGETYNGDLISPIDTKVGHIVSYNIQGVTADEDRVISSVQIDYGDGTTTDWISVEIPAPTINYEINHSYANAASALSARCRVRDDNLNISAWSPIITVNVANAEPVAILKAIPTTVRQGQPLTLDGSRSFDVEDGGAVTNFTFTPGDGSTATGPQPTSHLAHTYATAGEFMATMTCEDSSGATSNTARAVIKVLPARLIVPLILNTMPSSFVRTRSASFSTQPILDSQFPEMSDTGSRDDRFSLQGTFLTNTAEIDIAFMEDLLAAGHLVEFEWQAVNYAGSPDSRTFVGRLVNFSYQREGGLHGSTPWTAELVREAGVGQ